MRRVQPVTSVQIVSSSAQNAFSGSLSRTATPTTCQALCEGPKNPRTTEAEGCGNRTTTKSHCGCSQEEGQVELWASGSMTSLIRKARGTSLRKGPCMMIRSMGGICEEGEALRPGQRSWGWKARHVCGCPVWPECARVGVGMWEMGCGCRAPNRGAAL